MSSAVAHVCAFVWVVQEIAHAWEEYNRLEQSVEQLRLVLQAHMAHSDTSQVGLFSDSIKL